jgi:CheY-like chemotaxis protein
VTLPLRAPGAAADDEERDFEGEATPVDQAPTLEQLRVLVVDDEEDARELARTVLAGAGAEVRLASSVREGLAAIEGFRPHLLVSDIGLPGETGYDLIGRVRALGAERGGAIPAVALTALASEDHARRALLAGFQMHVPKPIEPDALVSVVARLAGWSPGR